jgi:hypothetical protein
MSKEAMKLALEALEPFKRMFREVEARHEGGITEANIHCQISVSDLRKCFYAFCDLEEALAKQEQGEPVGGFVQSPYGNYPILQWTDGYIAKMGDKLYTTPQQRKPPEWYAQWIRNNYQDHPNIATLCDEMTKAAHGIKD